MNDIEKLIHVEPPFQDFDPSLANEDMQGWGGHPEFFKRMIDLTEPKLIIEVGTWKGKSAIGMAKILDEITRGTTPDSMCGGSSTRLANTKILCVDTWLGATEMWGKKDDPKRYKSLRLKNGFPQLYYTFATNVIMNHVTHRIVPFPQTSVNAARHLQKHGVKADLIYVDASHEYEDVKVDLWTYYELLADGGIMCGDDYCQYWHGVKKAVNEFAAQKELVVETKQFANPNGEAPSDYWVVSKSGGIL